LVLCSVGMLHLNPALEVALLASAVNPYRASVLRVSELLIMVRFFSERFLHMRMLTCIADLPPPMLTSTGQPLPVPPLPQTTVNAALLPKDLIESRGRKRPSGEHREEPPTSRLRREISTEQTPQRYHHEEHVGHMQHAGPSSVSKLHVPDSGDRGNSAQAWEIPGVTTLLSHVSQLSAFLGLMSVLTFPVLSILVGTKSVSSETQLV
jgi:hypothetical protein